MDPMLLDVLTKLGFAGLAIWLIWDTRQEARKREDQLVQALVRAQADTVRAVENVTKTNQSMTHAINRLADSLDNKLRLAGEQSFKHAAEQVAVESER